MAQCVRPAPLHDERCPPPATGRAWPLMVDDGRPDAGLRREQAMALRARIEATRVAFGGGDTTTPAELREVLSAGRSG